MSIYRKYRERRELRRAWVVKMTSVCVCVCVCVRYKEKGRRRRMYVTNGTKIEEERKGVGSLGTKVIFFSIFIY